MQYSGVVVTAKSTYLDSVKEALTRLPGVEIHYAHPGRGKFVLVLEAESVDRHQETFYTIQAVPGVIDVELACHYLETPSGEQASLPTWDPT